jgi:hypothetical protein
MASFDIGSLSPLTQQLMEMNKMRGRTSSVSPALQLVTQPQQQPPQQLGALSVQQSPATSPGARYAPKNNRTIAAQGLLDMPDAQRPSLIDAFRDPNDVSNRGLVNLGLGLATGKGLGDSLARGIAGYQEGVDQGNQIAAEQIAQQNALRQQRIENANASQRLTLDQNQDSRAAELQPYKIAAEKAGIMDQTPDGGMVNKLTGEYIPPDPRIQAAVLKQLEAEGKIRVDIAAASAHASNIVNPDYRPGYTYQQGDGTIWETTFNGNNGQREYTNTRSGEVKSTLPKDAIRIDQSPVGAAARASGKVYGADEASAAQGAAEAYGVKSQLAALKQTAVGQTGSTLMMTAGRALSQFMGFEIGDIDQTNIDVARQMIADRALEAAQRMKGQGQITENERAMLAMTIPKLENDPEAFNTIIDILSKAEDRKIALYEGWESASPEVRARGWGSYAYQANKKQFSEGAFDPPPSQTGIYKNKTSTGVGYTIE